MRACVCSTRTAAGVQGSSTSGRTGARACAALEQRQGCRVEPGAKGRALVCNKVGQQRQQCAPSALTLTSLLASAMRLHCMLVIFSQLAGSLFLYLSPMYFLMAARLEPLRCVGGEVGGVRCEGAAAADAGQTEESVSEQKSKRKEGAGRQAGSMAPIGQQAATKSTLAGRVRERGDGGNET